MDNELKRLKLKAKLDLEKVQLEWEENKLEHKISWRKEQGKMNSYIMWVCGITLFILCLFTTFLSMKMNGFNVFSISLLTVTGYCQLREWVNRRFELDMEIKTSQYAVSKIKKDIKDTEDELLEFGYYEFEDNEEC